MAHVDQGVILNDGKVSEILKYFGQDGAVEKNREFVAGFKKNKASGNMIFAGVFAVICALGAVYGFVDIFTDARLPMGVIFLIGGVIGFFFSFVVMDKSLFRFAAASKFSYAASIEDLCRQFYSAAFCFAGTDSESREDYLADVSHLIPAAVLENYQGEGWAFFEGREKKRIGESEPIACDACDKAHGHSARTYISVPISDGVEDGPRQKKIAYLKCDHCGYKICYNCASNSSPSELKYLCPKCGKAANGIKGLGDRWDSCRRRSSRSDNDFEISELSVSQGDRINEKAVKIVVSLTGKPYGSMEFKNVAIHIGESWFLATPEPLIKK